MREWMYVYMVIRILWGIFLGIILIVGFKRSWKAEHDLSSRQDTEKSDAVVWMDPMVFLMLIVYFALCSLFMDVLYIVGMAMDILIFISLYFTVLLLLMPLIRRVYTAKTCAVFWLVPVFLFYQPHILYQWILTFPYYVIYVPAPVFRWFLFIWTAGFIVFFLFQLISHMLYCSRMKKDSYPVTDPAILKKWDEKKESIHFHCPAELRYCGRIRTPVTVGLRMKRQITYLPEVKYTLSDLDLIFSHELHHIHRKDTHTKFFLRFCNALVWIHPFVWAAVRKAEEDLELSCDEIVLEKASPDMRRQYAELLLTTAGNSKGYTTCLSGAAKALRYRIRHTMADSRKKLGMGLLFLVMLVSVLSVGKIAVSTDRQQVKELIHTDAGAISKVWIMSGRKGENQERMIQNSRAVERYLSEKKADRMLYRYMPDSDAAERTLSFLTAGEEYVVLTDQYMEIRCDGKNSWYYIREPMDWDYLLTIR